MALSVAAASPRLVASGISARSITAITFTRKAAIELRDRLTSRLAGHAHHHHVAVSATTFHALALELLRAFPREAGLPPGFTIVDEEARLALVEEACAGGDVPAAKAQAAISRAKACGLAPGDRGVAPEIAAIWRAVRDRMAARSALDFDDLVLGATALLAEHEPARALAHERCRWLFVDEVQDVNPAQVAFVRRLVPEGGSLCAVGDPDQSIYGFRGSDPSLMERLHPPDAPPSRAVLARNHRSSPSVVRAAARVIERAKGRASRPPVVRRGSSPPVERVLAPTDRDEVEAIAAEIERAVGGTSLYSIDAGRAEGDERLAFHDVAVLVRLGAHADLIEEVFTRAGIPCSRAEGAPLSSRADVAPIVRRLREIALEPPCGDAVSVSDLIMREVGDDPRRRRAAELMGILALPFGSDLAAFLDDLSLTRDSDVALEPQKVALLTLHAAKGLEFPLVFVAGCEDGLLPLDVPGLDVDVEEERRLLYVGMTRARDRLVLTGAARRTLFGRRLPGRESPFLAGIVDESLASVRTIARRPPRSRQLSLL